MRLTILDISFVERSLVNSFASWLLDVDDGKIGEPAEEDPENTSLVHIPPAYYLPPDEQDYIGYLRSTGSTSDFEDPNTRQGVRRKIKIENLNGKIVEGTLWDEMANHFGNANIDSTEQPVIITISSCQVLKYIAANKVTDHSCTELVEKYKQADPTKIPPEILATQGKHGVFQFHFSTLGNLTDLSLDAVYDIQKQDHNTSSNTKDVNKGDRNFT
nr:hypothetical protein [Tanacetum cinerariifolium]